MLNSGDRYGNLLLISSYLYKDVKSCSRRQVYHFLYLRILSPNELYFAILRALDLALCLHVAFESTSFF
jgi:hypothetical protein